MEILFSVNSAFESQTPKINRPGDSGQIVGCSRLIVDTSIQQSHDYLNINRDFGQILTSVIDFTFQICRPIKKSWDSQIYFVFTIMTRFSQTLTRPFISYHVSELRPRSSLKTNIGVFHVNSSSAWRHFYFSARKIIILKFLEGTCLSSSRKASIVFSCCRFVLLFGTMV